jgi:hypothetical protein
MDYSTHHFPTPPTGGGQRGAFSSADPGAGAGEFAVGFVAAFVDAFQAFRDDCLQLLNLFLLFGFSRIHRNRFYDVIWNGDGMRRAEKLTAMLSETPTG